MSGSCFLTRVLELPKSERAKYADQDIIAVPEIGSFAPVLLPITMVSGYRLTLGTWLGFDGLQMYQRAVALWNAPGYSQMVLEGRLANEVMPWNALMGLRVRATAKQDDKIPYVTEVLSNNAQALVDADWDCEWGHGGVPGHLVESQPLGSQRPVTVAKRAAGSVPGALFLPKIAPSSALISATRWGGPGCSQSTSLLAKHDRPGWRRRFPQWRHRAKFHSSGSSVPQAGQVKSSSFTMVICRHSGHRRNSNAVVKRLG
jgi:hypothetical protein